ncbi:MFS transporter [Enterococcus avium]
MKKTLYLVLLYFLISCSDNLRGILVPFIRQTYHLSNNGVALFITLSMIVFAIFQWVGGYILHYFSLKETQWISFASTMLGTILILFAHSYFFFLTGIIFISLSVANYNMIIATEGPKINPRRSVSIMNGLGISYTLSGILVQGVANQYLTHCTNWKFLYIGFCISTLMVVGGFLIIAKNFPDSNISSKNTIKTDGTDTFCEPQLRLTVLFAVIVACYSGAEYAVTNWFPTYLADFSFSLAQRGTLQSVFLGTRTVGLVLFVLFGNRLTSKTAIRLCLIVNISLIIIGVTLGKLGCLLIAFSGVGFSGIFPSILVGISQALKNKLTKQTGKILALGYLLAAMINQLLGIFSDNFGVIATFIVIPILLVMVFILNERIRYK